MSRDPDKRRRGPVPSLLSLDSVTALERTLRSEVIPRLVRAHRRQGPTGRAATAPGPGDVDRFLLEILADRAPEAYRTVELLLAEGVELDELCLGLLGPAANRLGQLWSDDRCDFTTVTVALGRLHRLMRELGTAFDTPLPSATKPPRALLAQPAEEQHLFGLAMVAEFLRRDGWDVLGGVGGSVPDPGARVREDAVDIVGLSIGSDERLDWVHETVQRVRAMSLNQNVKVLVGGPVFVLHPDWAAEVGADGTARDARQAVELAHALAVAGMSSMELGAPEE
jgi:methanogenic corrinoid protein MtbC1